MSMNSQMAMEPQVADIVSGPGISAEAAGLLADARNAAFAEVGQGRLGNGLMMLADALEREPMSHDLMSDISALLLSAGEFAYAAGYARKALAINPQHGPSLYALGFALAGLGEAVTAREVLQSALQDEALLSLVNEAPDLLPLIELELQRLQHRAGNTATQL